MEKMKKLLYIDSEEQYRSGVQQAVCDSNYECILCSSGKEGLNAIAQMNPDVVLVDATLSDMSGEELYTQFLTRSAYRPIRKTPFIILTRNGSNNRSQLYSLGFSGCLNKPFSAQHFVEFIEDVMISHQLKMEEVHYWEVIRESKDFLERVIESSLDLIITTDGRGMITYCNHACEDLLGYAYDELINKRISSFLESGTTELIKMSTYIKKKKNLQNYKIFALTKKGKSIPLNVSVSTMRNGNGRVIGALGIAKTISGDDFVEYENNVTDRMKAVIETAVAVNHAINNPLVPILGNAQFLLQDERLKDDDLRKRLRIIVKNALRIRDITQKLAAITNPVTKEYLKGTPMLDIDGSI